MHVEAMLIVLIAPWLLLALVLIWCVRQAEYYQDPLNEELYLQASIFLADINNAKAEKVRRGW